jgi:hypothetical protein
MENTMDSAARGGEQSAVQNAKSAGSVKLVMLWLAVGIPMLWGVMKALEDARKLLP